MKTIFTCLRVFLALSILTGVIYPMLMTGVAQLLFPRQSKGSLIFDSQNKIIGSELIAQEFKGSQYFWPRPSAVGYNPLPSGGSNLSVTSKDLHASILERKEKGLLFEMIYASGSGLDPHISVEAAQSQIPRVAQARAVDVESVDKMVKEATESRQFGFLGEERVNVLLLNRALDARMKPER